MSDTEAHLCAQVAAVLGVEINEHFFRKEGPPALCRAIAAMGDGDG